MGDTSNIFKIWGTRRRILLTTTSEIDLLYIKKDCFCSKHNHLNKINKFIVISGKIKIESEYGETILNANESFEIHPPLKHRFSALEDSIMIECAYTEKGDIDADDIKREIQGGRIIEGNYLSIPELKKRGLLDL